jgi:hypothetical protein
MWWNLNYYWVSWFWLLDITEWEMSLMTAQIIVLGEFINTINIKNSAVGYQRSIKSYFITGKVSISDELLSWLVDSKSFW